MWDLWTVQLPLEQLEPQEIELLGSIRMDFCLFFNYTGRNHTHAWSVNTLNIIYHNASVWCNYTTSNISKSTNQPLALPHGVFLICGDCAWPAIPSHIKGGPCSLGSLTLLTPNQIMIIGHQNTRYRGKRAIHAFTSDCKGNIAFWNSGEIITASLLAPGIAASWALATLKKMGCWLAKKTNATSRALSSLLLDVHSVRHATLQNRTEIDFLLLAQGHGCEEFDGMHCMNISDHSESNHRSLQRLKEEVKDLQIDDGWDWIASLFNDWGICGWLKGLMKIGLILWCVICGFLLFIPCLLSCLQRALQRMVNTAFLVEKQKGGDVGVGWATGGLDNLDEFHLYP